MTSSLTEMRQQQTSSTIRMFAHRVQITATKAENAPPENRAWSGIEEDIVRTSGNRAEAYRQLRLEGFKRTENATWAKYRKLKRKHNDDTSNN